MSTNTIIAFFVGAVAGAIAALMLAPKSGEDLRADLAREAQADRDRIMNEYNRANREMHSRLDKVQSDVQSTLEQVRGKAEEAKEEADEALAEAEEALNEADEALDSKE